MAREANVRPLADVLRQAVTETKLSYNALGRLAGVSQPQLHRFMHGQRDITLVIATRLCRALGLALVKVGPVLTVPVADPMPTMRGRKEKAAEKDSARGRGVAKKGRKRQGKE